MKKLVTFLLLSIMLSLGCSSDGGDEYSDVQDITIRLVNSDGELIRENVLLTVSGIRPDFNSIVP